MQSKYFNSPEEAIKFAESIKDGNAVDGCEMADGTFRVSWIANKMIKLPDGIEVVDEVWTKQDGTLIACQDLEPEHAKNIIRMLLRNDRERQKLTLEIMNAMQAMHLDLEDEDNNSEERTADLEPSRVLH